MAYDLSILIKAIVLGTAILIAAAAGIAADASSLHPTLRAAKLPGLIPTSAFFRDRPNSWHHRISPDGTKLLWVSSVLRRPTIHFRPMDGGPVQTLNTRPPGGLIQWASDNRRVIFLQDEDGDENHHLFVADTQSPEEPERDLTPFDGVKVRWQQVFSDDPAHLLILMNRRDRTLFDLYRINIETGVLNLVAENPGGYSPSDHGYGGGNRRPLPAAGRWCMAIGSTVNRKRNLEDFNHRHL